MARAFSGNDAHRCPDGVISQQGTARAYPVSDETQNAKSIRLATWNVGSLTGKSREIVDVMQRKINILCLQEVRWTGRVLGRYGMDTSCFIVEVKTNRME